jgi:hypothetical protein
MAQWNTVDSRACRESLVVRLSSVTDGSSGRWGKMSAHQMLCHLTYSFCAVIGERTVSSARTAIPRALLKWLVLWSPLKWPRNAPTRPEVAQDAGGTPPSDF